MVGDHEFSGAWSSTAAFHHGLSNINVVFVSSGNLEIPQRTRGYLAAHMLSTSPS